jgi:hypothetical protein
MPAPAPRGCRSTAPGPWPWSPTGPKGTVSLFTIVDGVVTPAGKVTVGDPDSSPAMVIFFDGDRRALVSRDHDHRIVQLSLEGATATLTPVSLAAGLRPYQIDTDGPRRFAVSGNIGGGGRDVDTISLIDLAPAVPRVVDTVAVGLTPEGLKMSPDGRYVAVNVNEGSNLSTKAPTYHPQGLVQVWRIDGQRLVKVAQAPVGAWGQGIAWSRDSRRLLVQSMVGQTSRPSPSTAAGCATKRPWPCPPDRPRSAPPSPSRHRRREPARISPERLCGSILGIRRVSSQTHNRFAPAQALPRALKERRVNHQ